MDLGLVYEIDVDEDGNVDVDMTLTSMGCPIADQIVRKVEMAAKRVDGVGQVDVELVWDPPWEPEMASDAGQTQLASLGVPF